MVAESDAQNRGYDKRQREAVSRLQIAAIAAAPMPARKHFSGRGGRENVPGCLSVAMRRTAEEARGNRRTQGLRHVSRKEDR